MKKSFSNKIRLTVFALSGLTVVSAAAAVPTTPLAAIKDSNASVKTVLDANNGKMSAKTETRLKEIISRATDFSAMSAAVMSAFPRTMTAAQRSKFRAAFEELLLLSSVKKMGRYRADRFEYGRERINGRQALVKTVAIYTKKDGRVDRVRLDYTLANTSGRWMITNYAMDDVDTIRNYQRQFRILVQRKGVAGTIQHIQNRVLEYRNED